MSSADEWIAWARRRAEEANGSAAGQGQRPPGAAAPGKRPFAEQPAFSERQGNAEHVAALATPAEDGPYALRQGNRDRGAGAGADESDPRRPGDPPWRGRTARRTSTPEAMHAFRNARLRRGWSLTRAAEETKVSRPHLSLLERGLRRPSESVAESIIRAYSMTAAEADAVEFIAVPWAGKDSPYRTGVEPGDL